MKNKEKMTGEELTREQQQPPCLPKMRYIRFEEHDTRKIPIIDAIF